MNIPKLKIAILSFLLPLSLMARPDNTKNPKVRKVVYVRYNNDFELNLSKLFIPVSNSIKIINAETGQEYNLRGDKDYEIRVIGQAGSMFEIQVQRHGVPIPGAFLSDPSNIKNGVNWAAVKSIVNNMDSIARGAIFRPLCLGRTPPPPRSVPVPSSEPQHSPYSKDGDVADSDTYVPPSDGEFLPGCEVLADQPIAKEKSDKLEKCVKSIQQAVTFGNRDANGQLNRKKVFKAMFSRLKPEEQAFAGYVFTAIGESDMWVDKNHPEEAMFVMKVLQNRKRMALEQGAKKPFNVLDVALDPWQFSTYNKGDPNWKKAIDPYKNTNFSGVVEAFRRMTDPAESSWEPKDQMNNVAHYRRDYLKDPWPASRGRRVRVYPSVNGVDLRSDSSTSHGAKGGRGYNYIYTNIDGPKNWIYSERSRGNWR